MKRVGYGGWRRAAALAAAWALSAAWCACAAPEAQGDFRARAARLPRVARGANGFVAVVAADRPGDAMGFRLPLLQFVSRLATDVAKAYSLAYPVGEAGITVRALDGATNDVRVLASTVAGPGGVRTVITLPSPGYSDIGALRTEVAKACFRAAIVSNAPAGGSGEFPVWFVNGLLRAIDREARRADTRELMALWRAGKMPFFHALCTDRAAVKGRGEAVACFLASWAKERNLVGDLLAAVRTGTGGESFESVLAMRLTGEKSAFGQDRVCDERLMLMTRRVLEPGRPAPEDLEVFASRLLLYPPFFDKMFGRGRPYLTFREAIRFGRRNPVVRVSAYLKARDVPALALGRGEKLQVAALAYAGFLRALAGGMASVPELESMLDAAEVKFEGAYEENREDDNR